MDPALEPLTAPKIDTWRIARVRDACAGVVRPEPMSFRAALFQSVTTSAHAVRTLAAHIRIVAIATAEFFFTVSMTDPSW